MKTYCRQYKTTDASGSDGVGTMLSQDRKCSGKIKCYSYRYCAVCGRNARCAIVKWEDGRITKPCLHGVKQVRCGVFKIGF